MSATGVSKREQDKLELINAVLRDKDREQVKKLIDSGINVNDIFVTGVNGPNTCLVRQAIHYGDLPGASFEEKSIACNLIRACSKETIEKLKELEIKHNLLKVWFQIRLTQKETPEQEKIKIESKECEVENNVKEETVAAESKPILAFQHDAEKASKRKPGHSVEDRLEFFLSLARNLRHGRLREAVIQLHNTADKRFYISEADLAQFDESIEQSRNQNEEVVRKYRWKHTVAANESAKILRNNFSEDEKLFRDTLKKYRSGQFLGQYKSANPWRDYNAFMSYT